MKKYEQKGNITLILLAALVALLAVAGYMVTSNTLVTKPSPTPGIMSSSDLEKAGKDLDSVNIDNLDTDLNAVTKDAAAI